MNHEPLREVFATFAGPIDNQASSKFFQFFNAALFDKMQKVHLLIQSAGGVIGDGVAIYNYLQGLPIEIATYNCGAADSASIYIYLAGKTRFVADTATFMMHNPSWTSPAPIPQTPQSLKDRKISLDEDIKRTKAILSKHLSLPPKTWSSIDRGELVINATKAIECGLSTEIGLFMPRPECQVIAIER